MDKNYPGRISILTPDELEKFVNDWLQHRCKEYKSHERWSGTGDLGRDVTGYVTDLRMDGEWDNFQCKQLSTRLSEKALFVELGKIFMHSAAGKYSLPRKYTFVAPRGVVREVREQIARPNDLRKAFLDRWDNYVADDLVENAQIKLTPEIKAKIELFEFKEVYWLDARKLAEDPACNQVLAKWFQADPGPSPLGVVPASIDASESAYIGQLLKVYEERGPGTYPDPATALACSQVGAHLKRQRQRFFDAVAFDRFYRDSTPDEFAQRFREEVRHGVAEVHEGKHPDKFERLNEVMKHASLLQASGVLGAHAGPQVKQGTCHMLANEGVMPWDK